MTARKMERLGILTGADLRDWSLPALRRSSAARPTGIGGSAAASTSAKSSPTGRTSRSAPSARSTRICATPSASAAELERIAGYAWDRVERAEVAGRTVTLKVKFGDFTLITRSKSFAAPVPDLEAFDAAGQALLAALHPLPKGIRLLGLGPSQS